MRKEDVLDTPDNKKAHSTEHCAVVQIIVWAWGAQEWALSAQEQICASLTTQETLHIV